MMTVEREIGSIESANINKETLDAMKNASKAMSAIHGGLTVDQVDQTMEDLREQHAVGEEIAEALTQGAHTAGVDEDELDEELAELQQEQLDERMLKTVSVPVSDQIQRMPNAPSTADTLAWVYYGAGGLARQIDHAFSMAGYLASLVEQHPEFSLVSSNPPPCLQVCFYYAPGGRLADDKGENTRRTRDMVHRLIARGFMVDYAPGPHGSFFRVVVNCQTLRGTVEGLLKALVEVGREVVKA